MRPIKEKLQDIRVPISQVIFSLQNSMLEQSLTHVTLQVRVTKRLEVVNFTAGIGSLDTGLDWGEILFEHLIEQRIPVDGDLEYIATVIINKVQEKLIREYH